MKRLILFAPGAGAPSSHPWMQNWKRRLSEIGDVETLDYAYMREGRKRPDPFAKACRGASRGVERREKTTSAKCAAFLIGKSMGGRVGCHLSLEEKVDGLVCLGYPLCAMGDRTKLRDEVLRALNYADSLCPRHAGYALSVGSPERVRAEMKTQNVLHVVEGGDHSLRVAKRQLQATIRTQEEFDRQILKAIAGFVDQLPMAAD